MDINEIDGMNDERNYNRMVKAFYFFLGVLAAVAVMHVLFVAPFLTTI